MGGIIRDFLVTLRGGVGDERDPASNMKTKYTKHQVARSAKPDGERFNVMYLIKNVQQLRATYQIRLLAFRAVDKKMKLVLRVPASCEFDASLRDLIERCGKAVFRENM
jgi:hypothetical protein